LRIASFITSEAGPNPPLQPTAAAIVVRRSSSSLRAAAAGEVGWSAKEAEKRMLFLKLDCGRQVSLDAFDYSRTYAGLLDGRPNAEMNAQIIERAITAREESWGKRVIHQIPPNVDLRDPEHPILPPLLLRAWLVCHQPINSAFMGSELVVVWFADECHAEPIADVVFRAVRALPWERLAADFDL
jgi:hypothetical protein